MVEFVNVNLKHKAKKKKGTSLIVTRQISSGWYNEHQQTTAKATGSHTSFLAAGVRHVGFTQVDAFDLTGALTASYGAT